MLTCTDHKGNTFPSISAICKHWNVSRDAFRSRLKRGWSLEEALTKKGLLPSNKPCIDHEGNTFPSISAMCKYWNVSALTFYKRLKRGWSLEEALTRSKVTPPNNKSCTDHKGNIFPSISAMCEHWGISYSTFYCRLEKGWSLEEALTGNRII